MWRFNTFVSSTGRTEVQDDVDRFSETVLPFFEAEVKYLAATTTPGDWKEPHAKKLKAHKGIYEIRFKADKVQWRPLGFFGPGPNEFTILVISTHKQNVYKPASAFETAATRKKAIEAGQAGVSPLKIDGEVFPPTDEA